MVEADVVIATLLSCTCLGTAEQVRCFWIREMPF